MSFNDVAVVSVKGNDYRIHFCYLSKDEAINLLKHADFTEKSGTLWNIKKLFPHIKMGKEINTFGDIEIEKHKFHRFKSPINNLKGTNTLLVTCIMIIKLRHYT